MYDILIKNGRIVDGLNRVPYEADIAIVGDEIVAVRRGIEGEAAHVIDAAGKIVTPGFIDIHCHSDAIVFHEKKNPLRLWQGFTTEVVGNCGISCAPINPENLELLRTYCNPFYSNVPVPYTWTTFGEYLDAVENAKPLLNTAALIGHGALRIAIAGFENRALTEEEQAYMCELLGQCMEEGAFGFSSGLIYPPGVFASHDEIKALAKTVQEYHGIYTTHMKNESINVIDSVKESIDLARETGISLEISHHKAHGIMNKGKPIETLRMMHEARDQGLDVNCDVYPYPSCSTTFSSVLPPWAQEGGIEKLLERVGNPEDRKRMIEDIKNSLEYENFYRYTGSWDKILINECAIAEYQGKTVQQIADEKGEDPFECALDIIRDCRNNVMMVAFTMNDEDVAAIVHDPISIICTDGFASLGPSHPRYTAAFVRVLEKYVKEEHLISLPEAIYKMTGMPAAKLGLKDRGTIAENKKADILVLDFEKLHDNSDYVRFDAPSDGIDYVIINGQIAVNQGTPDPSVTAGKVIRHQK